MNLPTIKSLTTPGVRTDGKPALAPAGVTYGGYQRATRGVHLSQLTAAQLVRCIRAKFDKKARRNPKLREGRKRCYLAAAEYAKHDLEIWHSVK